MAAVEQTVAEAWKRIERAAIKKQSKAVNINGVADGARVELIGSIGAPWNSMGPDEYRFEIYGTILRVKGKLAITRQQIMQANAKGELHMLRVAGIYHPRRLDEGHATLVLESFAPFE
jgi:hypothetical protein